MAMFGKISVTTLPNHYGCSFFQDSRGGCTGRGFDHVHRWDFYDVDSLTVIGLS